MVKVSGARAHSKARAHLASRSVGVRLAEIVGAGIRLEASAYALEARQVMAELQASQHPLKAVLGDNGICKRANNAFRFARMYVAPGKGVPFLSSSDIIGLRPERGNYLSLKTPRLDALKIEPWEILVSCSGTIGNVSLASPRMSEWAVSQHVIRITAPDPDTAGYIAAFLRSRWGRPQLTGMVYGSVVQHIEPHHLERVLTPDLPAIRRIAIGRAFVDAALKRDEANDKLDAADAQLRLALKLPPLPIPEEGPVVSCVRAADWAGRLDAAFHNPTARWVEQQLHASNLEVLPLGDERLSKAVKGVTKFRKRVYVEKGGIPLLSSKQLFQVDPIEVKRLARGAHQNDLEEICLAENMIAITRSGTIGRVQIVPKYMDGWANSEHTIRVIAVDNQTAGYLYAWLASDYGQALIGRYSYGSVIVEIDRFMIGELAIPLLPDAEIKAIARLVLDANRLRNEAWELEQSALRRLSSEIAGTHLNHAEN